MAQGAKDKQLRRNDADREANLADGARRPQAADLRTIKWWIRQMCFQDGLQNECKQHHDGETATENEDGTPSPISRMI